MFGPYCNRRLRCPSRRGSPGESAQRVFPGNIFATPFALYPRRPAPKCFAIGAWGSPAYSQRGSACAWLQRPQLNFRDTPCIHFILLAPQDRMLDLHLEDLTSGLEDEARLKHCGTEAPHDAQTMYLSLFLCVGVVVSYLPQHIRIIRK